MKEYRFKLTGQKGEIILKTTAENLNQAVENIGKQMRFDQNDIRQINCRPVKYPKFSDN
jgi:hypothetical protein